MRPDIQLTLKRLLAAAPGAFRGDPLFRYAAIGAVLSLLVLIGRLGGSHTPPAAGPPPAPTALGQRYGDPTAAGAPAATPDTSTPIAPSQSLDTLTIRPDPTAAPDAFGRVPSRSGHP